MESFLEIDCSGYSKNIIDILDVFHRIDWWIYNTENEVEYLPIADNDCFNWKCEKISEEEFRNIINTKKRNSELIGLNLFFNNSNIGISMLARDTKNITFGISINCKRLGNGCTDMAWYIENIIYKLVGVGMRIVSYKFGEFED